MGIEQMYIAAHSFGGYIAGVYALEHPDVVIANLIISGAGYTKNRKSL